MTATPHPTTTDLLDFIAASPTPHHCVAEASRRLDEAGFRALSMADAWELEPGGGYYVPQGGAVVAFRVGSKPAPEAGFRLVGAHTDSPNLRVKPVASYVEAGYDQLGVEVYGGALTYTWLDRDLGLAGNVVLRGETAGAVEGRLVRIDRPIVRVPSLAIHLNREIRTDGLQLNDQKHLAPVLGLAPTKEAGDGSDRDALQALLATTLEVDADRILSWDLSCFDLLPPTVGGAEGEFIFAPRLDNQAMCHAGLVALLRAGESETPEATSLIGLYDHEEVGSASTAGAGGRLTEDVIRRVAEVEGPGAVAGGLTRAAARSLQVSADMAHAIHPNYGDRHEPRHHPAMNGGPVIKINAKQRYATDARTAGIFETLCREAEVPCQKFVTRSDLPCGSTIGPISSTRLGIPTVDVGNPMLSMHSIREQGGAEDPERMTAVLARFLAS